MSRSQNARTTKIFVVLQVLTFNHRCKSRKYCL